MSMSIFKGRWFQKKKNSIGSSYESSKYSFFIVAKIKKKLVTYRKYHFFAKKEEKCCNL